MMTFSTKSLLSIELVPREIDQVVTVANQIAIQFDRLTWLNIPDIKRLPVRSHDAALACVHTPLRVIPHVRTRDRSVEESVALLRQLASGGIKDALIVTGDRFDQREPADHPHTLDLLQAATSAQVGINLWAAFDPYRGELRGEIEYAKAKVDAGAVGFFTQPFFDVRLAEICLDQLEGIPTFIGISPVTSERSAKYWERENRVVFPPQFEMTLDYSARLSARLIETAVAYEQHAYLMPITVDPIVYLEAAFAHVDAKAAQSSVP